jgi:hypothetical protein
MLLQHSMLLQSQLASCQFCLHTKPGLLLVLLLLLLLELATLSVLWESTASGTYFSSNHTGHESRTDER